MLLYTLFIYLVTRCYKTNASPAPIHMFLREYVDGFKSIYIIIITEIQITSCLANGSFFELTPFDITLVIFNITPVFFDSFITNWYKKVF